MVPLDTVRGSQSPKITRLLITSNCRAHWCFQAIRSILKRVQGGGGKDMLTKVMYSAHQRVSEGVQLCRNLVFLKRFSHSGGDSNL